MDFGDWLNIVSMLAFLSLPLIAILKSRHHRSAVDRPDIPYAVYTSEFDVVSMACDVPSQVRKGGHPDYVPMLTELPDRQDRVAAALVAYEDAKQEENLAELRHVLRVIPKDTSLALLVDLSGSMRDRIVSLAGQIRLLVEELSTAKIETAVLGFTTLSWKGGQARLEWVSKGKPKYPGRLCPLLHVIFKPFDQPLDPVNWEVLLDATCLRENVDGEAIEWAAQLLRDRPAGDRRLIMISDGIPMDDSTAAENGLGFLLRHLQSTITQLEFESEVRPALIRYSEYDPGCFLWREEIIDSTEFLGAFTHLTRDMNEAKFP